MIIWLASYPKSGNTWIRSLLSSYFFTKDGKFTFKLLDNIGRFSINENLINFKDKSNYQSEISRVWIPTQELINKNKKINFLKTHNAICSINGNKFTDKINTIGAIYIIRDPRNLITSLANHYELTADKAFDFLINKRKIIFPENYGTKDQKNRNYHEFNFLGDWSGHYYSWKNINFCPIKVIKYEDFLANPKKSFISLLNFLSQFFAFNLDENKIDDSIKSTNFNTLSKMENNVGFEESAYSQKKGKKIKFFNLGKKNDWNNLLDKKLIRKIETHFKKEMQELGYL